MNLIDIDRTYSMLLNNHRPDSGGSLSVGHLLSLRAPGLYVLQALGALEPPRRMKNNDLIDICNGLNPPRLIDYVPNHFYIDICNGFADFS